MLYKFKSRSSGDLIMLEANGRRVLEVIGKGAGAKGIILAEEIPAAIAALEAAIALEESQAKDAPDIPRESPGLRQRATPFIDMLKRNHHAGHEVVWGV